jgi:hypothetical protein
MNPITHGNAIDREPVDDVRANQVPIARCQRYERASERRAELRAALPLQQRELRVGASATASTS